MIKPFAIRVYDNDLPSARILEFETHKERDDYIAMQEGDFRCFAFDVDEDHATVMGALSVRKRNHHVDFLIRVVGEAPGYSLEDAERQMIASLDELTMTGTQDDEDGVKIDYFGRPEGRE